MKFDIIGVATALGLAGLAGYGFYLALHGALAPLFAVFAR